MRHVMVPEPQLYRRSQLQISDCHGREDLSHLVPRCPVALSNQQCGDSDCRIRRNGAITRHGILSNGFPEALSGVPQYFCSTHNKKFNLLQPDVHEALPADAVLLPEVVVLTRDLVIRKEAYLNLATQVSTAAQCTSPAWCYFHGRDRKRIATTSICQG